MRPLAVGWVWTNDPTAPVATTPKLLPLLGVGVWFWAVLLRSWILGVIAVLLAEIQKFGPKA